MFLSKYQITEMTGTGDSKGQIKALKEMGIEHKVNPIGGIIVLRDHVIWALGGMKEKKPRERTKPDLSSFHAS